MRHQAIVRAVSAKDVSGGWYRPLLDASLFEESANVCCPVNQEARAMLLAGQRR
jgi:hypothetical protein